MTNAPVADLAVVYATLDPKLGATGITAFIVERATQGLSVGARFDKLGLRTSPMAELIFDGCCVPAGNRLGREGLETCRPLVYRIGRLKDAGQSAVQEAAIAKRWVSECFVQSSLDAVQVFGGYGYMREQGLAQDLRDSIGGRLYSGTSEIQRNIIAKTLGAC